MDSLFLISILIGVGCAGVTIAAIVLLVRRTDPEPVKTTDTDLCMIFEEDRLIDADDAIWPLLTDHAGSAEWSDVRLALLPFIPALPENITDLAAIRTDAGIELNVEQTGRRCRVTLSPSGDQNTDWFQARQNEITLTRLRPALIHAPEPIWSLSSDGDFIWGNDAFARYADAHGGPRAFADHISDLLSRSDVLRSRRLKLDAPDLGHTQKRWLEVTKKEIETGTLYFATGIDAVVRAEEAQRNFVQTLSKTFANLTTGLAIFDRDRRLALFNPALIDLSAVSVEFLSSRPALFEFFDKLREKQVMPEPKCYDDWRERMAKLVAAASDDRFRETWNLAGGQTLDVTGRPYPDGAIAFLFNDITAEVSLTRGFRTELETMQSLLDVLEDAVAVFNQQGVLTACNEAYKQMWKVDPDTCIADSTIVDATQEWKAAFHPSPVWPELRDFVISTSERASWDSELRSKDGREVICRVDPICFGSTLVRFCHAEKRRDETSETDRLHMVSLPA
ncbi:PAS-domain containing protein [uncultured Marivita sp.]|uniref:PAS-domain containing protein n=1 Tax=uncultured Marivita sp. TaxID=888080 RepID=UPI0026120343|nr:PAS-domain containing protein [uncultured Marivita sp.]